MADAAAGLARLTAKVLLNRPVALIYTRESEHTENTKVSIRFVMDVMKKNAARFAGTAAAH